MVTQIATRFLLVVAILGLSVWAAAAALYFGPLQATPSAVAVATVGLVAAIAAVVPRLRWWPLAVFTVVFIAFLIRWPSRSAAA